MAAEPGKGDYQSLNDLILPFINANALLGLDVELQAPGDAITGLAFHPNDPDRLLCSSWDAVRDYQCTYQASC